MKRVIIAVLSLVIFTGTINAQDEADWRFGIKVQPSVSWLGTSLKEFQNGKPKLNFGYGLIVEKGLFKNTVLASGLFINDFGGKYKYIGLDKRINFKSYDNSTFFVSRSMRMKYVELPVVLKFRTTEINYITYFAHFGLDMGFRVKARGDDDFGDIKPGSKPDGVYPNIDLTRDISFIKLGLDVGIGGEYSIAGSTALLVGMSYINGFTNLTRKNSELLIYVDNSKVKQIFYGHTFMLSVGILF